LSLVAGAVYFYNTSSIFADEPACTRNELVDAAKDPKTNKAIDPHFAQPLEHPPSGPVRTLESIAEEKKARQAASVAVAEAPVPSPSPEPGSPEALEEEAESQGAFNPETGEINWDCPCLGGMAHGPCGEEFKAAFSCFVYSTEEPKGMDCIDKFKGMQECFRKYPEVYGAELEDEEGEEGADGAPAAVAAQGGKPVEESKGAAEAAPVPTPAPEPTKEQGKAEKIERAKPTMEQVKREHEPLSEADEAIPKAWHDTRDASPEKK
jgi:intermembrane space import and assembly protein 40